MVGSHVLCSPFVYYFTNKTRLTVISELHSAGWDRFPFTTGKNSEGATCYCKTGRSANCSSPRVMATRSPCQRRVYI